MSKVVNEIKYRDLADLIFILSDKVRFYFDLEEYEDVTVDQLTEWLCEQKGSVQLRVG